ncbi:MAG: tetratricopeptide repeat protein [Deltaproteobacteria bacterium]|nr:tetratricopeptide repeat protein [Deltaproteobacteria bacterium]
MKKFTLALIALFLCISIIFPLTVSAELNQYKYFYRGKRYFNLGDYDRAIRDFTRAIEKEKNYVFAYAERGLAWEKKGSHEKALADYDKAIEINPQYVKAIKYRATTWQAMGEYAKAIDDYNKVIELDPEDSEAFYQIGCIYSIQKDKKDALQYLELALENGYQDFESIENDPVWDDVKESSEFKELIQKYKQSASL